MDDVKESWPHPTGSEEPYMGISPQTQVPVKHY